MQSGVVLPFFDGFMVLDTHFYNFNRSTCAAFAFTRIIGTCVHICGGFRYVTSGLSFSESPQKVASDSLSHHDFYFSLLYLVLSQHGRELALAGWLA